MFAGVIAATALIGQILAGRVVNGRQAVRIATLENETAVAKLDLEKLKASQRWRSVAQNGAFTDALKGHAGETVEILVIREDQEAFLFANSIWYALLTADWPVDPPTVDDSGDTSRPFSLRYGGMIASNMPTLIIATGEQPPGELCKAGACAALKQAFIIAGFTPLVLTPHQAIRPNPGVIRVIVGSRF